jgi:hypothetical protein
MFDRHKFDELTLRLAGLRCAGEDASADLGTTLLDISTCDQQVAILREIKRPQFSPKRRGLSLDMAAVVRANCARVYPDKNHYVIKEFTLIMQMPSPPTSSGDSSPTRRTTCYGQAVAAGITTEAPHRSAAIRTLVLTSPNY